MTDDFLTPEPDTYRFEMLDGIPTLRCYNTILKEISNERARQIAKWGIGQGLTPIEYCAILGEEFGEVCRAAHDAYFAAQYPEQINATPGDWAQYRKELIQVAAVCVAAISNIPNQKQ